MSSSKNPDVYVAKYPKRTTSDDLKDLFKKYGKVRKVLLKDGFAFIVFYIQYLVYTYNDLILGI